MSTRTASIRSILQPGDIGAITRLHGLLYSAEYGFDIRFEAYVALGPGEFAATAERSRSRIW